MKDKFNIDEFEKNIKENYKFTKKEQEIYIENAKLLLSKNLPIILDYSHFSKLTGINVDYIYAVCNNTKRFYRNFYIPKKSGKLRKINEPLPDLKTLQSWILNNILVKQKVSVYTKAYRKNHSIKSSAAFHIGKKMILNIDLKDYFPSLKETLVYQFFLNLGYFKDVAMILTKVCCLGGCLPQGAVTSPMLSNILTFNLDFDLSKFAKENSLHYTKYADDITLSGDFNAKEVYDSIKKIINKNGFLINYDKVKVFRNYNSQNVTGIIVNQKMQVPKDYRRRIRQEIFFIKKHGIKKHLSIKGLNEIDNKSYVISLLSKVNYVLFVNKEDKEFIEYRKFLKLWMEDAIL